MSATRWPVGQVLKTLQIMNIFIHQQCGRVFTNRTALLRHKYLCRFKRKLNKIRLSPFWFTSWRYVDVLVCRRFDHRPSGIHQVLDGLRIWRWRSTDFNMNNIYNADENPFDPILSGLWTNGGPIRGGSADLWVRCCSATRPGRLSRPWPCLQHMPSASDESPHSTAVCWRLLLAGTVQAQLVT